MSTSSDYRYSPQTDYSIKPRALPPTAPLTSRDPMEIAQAIVKLDEQALAQALAQKLPPVNDPLPATFGKTPLHLAVRMYSLKMTSHSNADRQDAIKLDRMIATLLAAGANPVARDAKHLHPSAYAEAIPSCLRERMLEEAAQDRVDWEPDAANKNGRITSKRSARYSRHTRACGHSTRFLPVGCA